MSGTWQHFNGEKGLGKGRDWWKVAWRIWNKKAALKIKQNGQKQKREGEGTFKERDGDLGEKFRFMLLAGRFVCYEAFRVSSRKGESYN